MRLKERKILKEKIDKIINITGRSANQTEYLLEILECDFNKLILLEKSLKNNHICYCPETIEECMSIINTTPKTYWFTKLDTFKIE